MVDYSFGIITVSDSCFRGEAIDKCGPRVKVLLQNYYNALKIFQSTVPDDIDEIVKMMLYYADTFRLNCIITIGGTGCSKRDVTPEATKKIIEREIPQLSTMILLWGLRTSQFAALSRGVCGIRGDTLIMNFPGNLKACEEHFEAITELLPHALESICDEKSKTLESHKEIQSDTTEINETGALALNNENLTTTDGCNIANDSECSSTLALEPDVNLQNDTKITSTGLKSSISTSSIIRTKNDVSNILKELTSNIDNVIFDNGADFSSIQEKKKSNPEPNTSSKVQQVRSNKKASSIDQSDRNLSYLTVNVAKALDLIFENINSISAPEIFKSPVNCLSFRASLKDGYAMKSSSSSKIRKVIGLVKAGDGIIKSDFANDECYEIKTGAPVPECADCVLQIMYASKIMKNNQNGTIVEIKLLTMPKRNQDIRSIGADLRQHEIMFTTCGMLDVPEKTLLATTGFTFIQKIPRIAVISIGDELVDLTSGDLPEGKIFDSNTTMLILLCQKYGFDVKFSKIVKDDYKCLKSAVQAAIDGCQVIISTGGISMDNKNYIKPLLQEFGFDIHFGRVNMKDGKWLTFATNENRCSFFVLPENSVSAFVSFHLMVLPALRFMSGFSRIKSVLPIISVILKDSKYVLDPRAEFVGAKISFNRKTEKYEALITLNHSSNRMLSLVHADALLHLPPASEVKNGTIVKGWKFKATLINQFFLSDIMN